MGQILDGKAFANLRAQELKEKVKKLKEQAIMPLFCVINIGDDRASRIYLRTKRKRAEQVGIIQRVYQLPASVEEKEVLALISRLNHDSQVYGIMIQLPVPARLNAARLLAHIDPNKDVDGLTPSNVGRLWQGRHFVEPATAAGIMALLAHYHIDPRGKNVVIVGRSPIVGKPIAALMLEKNATISILHTKTRDFSDYTKKADILVSAAGQAKLITADLVKKGVVVIDVGINYLGHHLVGDVDFQAVAPKASYITPVPGGVGPLTVEFLMEEVVKLTERANGYRR